MGPVPLILWLAIGAAAFLYGGVLWEHWLPCLAVILVSAAAAAGSRRRESWPRVGRIPAIALGVALAVAAGQLVPLPEPVLEWLTPARAELQDTFSSVLGRPGPAAPSLVPAASLRWTLTLVGLVAVFLVARASLVRGPERVWRPAVPLLALGGFEAVLGLAQVYLAGQPLATGTYVNRNHYAGLLEMALPFAAMGAVGVMKGRRSRRLTVRRALAASGLFALAGLMLAAIIQSLSRAGFAFALASLAVMGAVALAGPKGRAGWKRRAAAGVAAAAAAAAFVFLPTDPLIFRFGALAATEEISADTRVQVWRDTLKLIEDYPVAGVGLGGYTAAIHRYQTAAPTQTIGMAHNDYLQLAAELGLPGFAALLLLAGWALARAGKAASLHDPARRYLGLACLGALTALALHSLVDFNLYLPANAAALAWIAGLATVLPSLPATRPRNARRLPLPPPVFEAEPLSRS